MSEEFCNQVKERLSEKLETSFKVLPHAKISENALHLTRGQYISARILDQIAEQRPPDGSKLIGITNVDLCTPVLTFVFGAARLGGDVAVVSTYRLRPEFYGLPSDEALFFKRILKEVTHELGHVFGLSHCSSSTCVMYLANSIQQIDLKTEGFCAACGEFITTQLRRQED